MPSSSVMERIWSKRRVSQVSPPPTRKRSIRAACSRGTRAASLTLPMRRRLRSSTGMDSNSVKYKRLSAIENAPAPDNSSTNPDGSDLSPALVLYTAFRRHFQYGSSPREAASKKGNYLWFIAGGRGFIARGRGNRPRFHSTTGTSPDSIIRRPEVTSFSLWTRAVAAIARSAGSGDIGCQREQTKCRIGIQVLEKLVERPG